MIHFAARDAKNNFGQLLDTARQEPVIIDKKGRPVAVLMATEEYERLERLEENFLILKARLASKEGFIGIEESEDFLKSILNAAD